jgi:Glyoxalase-like domain
MLLGIDHLVIAVADPDDAVERFADAVGRTPTGGGRHDALGTFNRIVWLGDSYLEFIGVFDRGRAERSWLGRPALKALEAGGGFATWAIATDDVYADVARVRPGGSSLAEPRPDERQRDDGSVVRWRLAAPDPLGPGEPPFLIEHDATAAEWAPADRAERAAQAERLGGPIVLDALELPVDDPNVAGQRLARTVGLRFRPSLAGGGARDASIGRQIVRLRPRRGGAAAPAIRLRAAVADDRTVELFGCRWMVAPRG